jgi:antitoxin (DNA-binding transcriptional repressor) of toxin-antitoxin stability system
MTSKRISASEAAQQLPDLLEAVRQGEDVVIETEGKAAVQLVLVKPLSAIRELGAYRGKIEMRDDFNDPLDDEFGEIKVP